MFLIAYYVMVDYVAKRIRERTQKVIIAENLDDICRERAYGWNLTCRYLCVNEVEENWNAKTRAIQWYPTDAKTTNEDYPMQWARYQ